MFQNELQGPVTIIYIRVVWQELGTIWIISCNGCYRTVWYQHFSILFYYFDIFISELLGKHVF